MVQRRRKQSRAEREAESVAQENFKKDVLRLDHHRCVGASVFPSQHRCHGPLEIHHVIRQQTLRVHISTLELTEDEINDWLWAAGVGITLCHGAHQRHSSRVERVPWEWIPARVNDWCTDREVLHLAKHEHPPLFVESDR